MQVNNIASFIREIKEEINRERRNAVNEMKMAARIVLQELMNKTPVWSGETVRNYTVGIGNANPIYSGYVDNGPPGDTNNMPLGVEPRRGPNEAAAMTSAEAVLGGYTDLKRNIFISNAVEGAKWDLIDSGQAPTPELVRYAAVISILALQSANARLEHFK